AAMTEYGFALSSEEHRPMDLVRYAQRAEELGFSFVSLSDHYHPWIDQQGQSPFAWCVVGGVAAVTNRIELGMGVTCPTIRIHPAVLAQAAATSADMMPGRFFFGVGSGENLNEHILGDRWPADLDVRQEMMVEAVEVIRKLWQGGYTSHHGKHYTVENARIYTLPAELPPIIVSATGKKAAKIAAEIGDGLWSTAPDKEVVDAWKQAGGTGPVYGQLTVCFHDDESQAKKIAREWWPNTSIPGNLSQELPLPLHFEQAAELVTEDKVAEKLVCGPDPERYVERLREYEEAGFTHLYLHQVGPDQDAFFSFWERELKRRVTA
ncbi:MAG TPA: TIGR03557 family F420-dependent LLM class oxidoreductase, partial [Acidimicrobiales bacterium]